KQHEGIDVSFPAARQRQIGARDLLRHHPQRKDVAAVWSKPESPVLFGDDGGVQLRAKQIFEILGRKRCGLIILRGAGSEILTRKHGHAVDQLLLLETEIEQVVSLINCGGSSCHLFSTFRATEVLISFPVMSRN